MTTHAEPTEEPTPRLRHVLVVEDHPEMRRLLVSLLQSEGHGVVEASDGLKALASLLRRRGEPEIDLLVTDLRMPGCTGLDLLALVRLERPEMPVVLITAFGDPATHLEARALGAAAVFDKPFDLRAFRDAVRVLLRGPAA